MNLSTHKKSEVELRVAQELKNNQDFIYQTNQKLQSLGQGMIALSIQNEKLKAQMDSDKKSIQIDQENHMKEVHNVLSMACRNIDQFEKRVELLLDETQKRLNLFHEQLVHYEVLDEKFKAIADWMNSFEASYERLCGMVNCSVNLLQGKIASEVDQVRKDLTPDPNAVNPIKKEVQDLLDSMRVDFQGLIREIALIKKDVAYGEKKFENIYTLIERLKAGKV